MIVVTGGTGTMATALREFLPDATYLSRKDWDVTKAATFPAKATAIIHCAALTDHQHPNAAEIIETNIMGTEAVATACRKFGLRMVYLSTHYVYPGETGGYRETDPVRPIGTYAWSKLAGEAWAATVPDHLIIRGSWYSPDKLARMAFGALTDAWHNRERPRDAAQKIATLVTKGAEGVFNIGGRRRTFYELCFAEGVMPVKATRAKLNARIPYPFPVDSSVNTDKYDAFVR